MAMYSYRVWGNGHSNERTIIRETVLFHKRWEMFMPRRYPDGFWSRDYWPPGTDPNGPPARRKGDVLWSIYYGHAEGGDNPPYIIPEDMEGTEADAEALLLLDIGPKARWVNARIPPDKVPLTQYMYGAIISLAYQFGQGRLDYAQIGLHAPDQENPNGRPIIIDGEQKSFPFIEAFHKGRYVKALTIMRDLNFKKDGSIHDGLTLRRCTEVGFAMTKIDAP